MGSAEGAHSRSEVIFQKKVIGGREGRRGGGGGGGGVRNPPALIAEALGACKIDLHRQQMPLSL